jgi:hypothetical protein
MKVLETKEGFLRTTVEKWSAIKAESDRELCRQDDPWFILKRPCMDK